MDTGIHEAHFSSRSRSPSAFPTPGLYEALSPLHSGTDLRPGRLRRLSVRRPHWHRHAPETAGSGAAVQHLTHLPQRPITLQKLWQAALSVHADTERPDPRWKVWIPVSIRPATTEEMSFPANEAGAQHGGRQGRGTHLPALRTEPPTGHTRPYRPAARYSPSSP